MSKGKGQKGADPRREERRRTQLAQLKERAATEPAPPRRERVEPVDISGNEHAYEPLLHAIESGLLIAWNERDGLLVDDEAERALRLVIAHYGLVKDLVPDLEPPFQAGLRGENGKLLFNEPYEGDTDRLSGADDIDLLADNVRLNIDAMLPSRPYTRAEIIGGLRRVIESVRTHHDPGDPRAYFAFIAEFIPVPEIQYPDPDTVRELQSQPLQPSSQIWTPGAAALDPAPSPDRPGGLWLPGDNP